MRALPTMVIRACELGASRLSLAGSADSATVDGAGGAGGVGVATLDGAGESGWGATAMLDGAGESGLEGSGPPMESVQIQAAAAKTSTAAHARWKRGVRAMRPAAVMACERMALACELRAFVRLREGAVTRDGAGDSGREGATSGATAVAGAV